MFHLCNAYFKKAALTHLALANKIFNLDVWLADLCKDTRDIINTISGVLIITNQEFEMLMYQSMRHLQRAATSNVSVSLQDGNLAVPSAFGVTQDFTVDLDGVDPDSMRDTDPVLIRYSAVILVATKACLRISKLKYSFDSRPMLSAVKFWSEAVHMQ